MEEKTFIDILGIILTFNFLGFFVVFITFKDRKNEMDWLKKDIKRLEEEVFKIKWK
jgi:hypothetical protein